MVGAGLTAVKIWNDDTVVVVVAVASSRLAAWIIVAAAAAFGSVFQWLDMDSDERKAGVVAWVAVVVFAVAVAVAFVVDDAHIHFAVAILAHTDSFGPRGTEEIVAAERVAGERHDVTERACK